MQLIDISVRDKQNHPRLAGRITGHVRAVLSERLDNRQHTHELAIPVWADISADASDADMDMAMLLKAANIIGRLKSTLVTASLYQPR